MMQYISRLKLLLKKSRKKSVKTASAVMGLALLPGLIYLAFVTVFWGRVYPGVSVAGVEVSRYTTVQVWQSLDILERDFVSEGVIEFEVSPAPESSKSGTMKVVFDLMEADVRYDPITTSSKALGFGRSGGLMEMISEQLKGLGDGESLSHEFEVSEEYLDKFVADLAESVDRPGARPELRLSELDSSEVEVFAGEDGLKLNQENLKERLRQSLANLSRDAGVVRLGVEVNRPTESEVEVARERALKLLGKELQISLDQEAKGTSKSWVLDDSEIVGFVGFEKKFDEERVANYVNAIAESVNREAQNANFKFESGRVVEFAPSLDGVVVNEEETVVRIVVALAQLEIGGDEESEVILAVRLVPPSLTTPDVNDLGLVELLGRGESIFKGSIAGRVHNVALTASRLHGILIPPGEIFSFNGTIGDVSRATGYRSAYIIKDGRTILGDGGGVCQDSTTLFRAVLDAGLPIVERKAHSYRVGYYEQNSEPGFDATVFSPTVDLKFKNDTPAHILIQATANTDNLTLRVDLYGTSDGREAVIANYQKWGAVPAPPPLYQDDPTLAPGVVRQVDWAAPGLKVKFDYIVSKSGEIMFEKSFYSNFRPWQAVYLRGV